MSVLQRLSGTATNTDGSGAKSANVTVFYGGGKKGRAVTYVDEAGSAVRPSPFAADSLGRWFCYVLPGQYDIHIQSGDRVVTLRDQETQSEELLGPDSRWDNPIEERLRVLEAQVVELFEMVMGDTIAEPPG
ncbi:hypothetical protein LCGC14_2538620 [marine sediment metagenome]|uniref:Uncharacterized protein n=1 Tax=marine sediment metagenome TaxID=412755 RepID=A0A0F9DJF6_9ZZZZ